MSSSQTPTLLVAEAPRLLRLQDPISKAFCSHPFSPDLQPTQPTFNGQVLLALPPESFWNPLTAQPPSDIIMNQATVSTCLIINTSELVSPFLLLLLQSRTPHRDQRNTFRMHIQTDHSFLMAPHCSVG